MVQQAAYRPATSEVLDLSLLSCYDVERKHITLGPNQILDKIKPASEIGRRWLVLPPTGAGRAAAGPWPARGAPPRRAMPVARRPG